QDATVRLELSVPQQVQHDPHAEGAGPAAGYARLASRRVAAAVSADAAAGDVRAITGSPSRTHGDLPEPAVDGRRSAAGRSRVAQRRAADYGQSAPWCVWEALHR